MKNKEQNIFRKNINKRNEGSKYENRTATQKDYESLFINSPSERISHRKCIYVNETFVDLISRLISVNQGSKLSIGGYVNVVLEKHLETYKDEIQEFYNQNTSKPLNI